MSMKTMLSGVTMKQVKEAVGIATVCLTAVASGIDTVQKHRERRTKKENENEKQ